jgi:hypothetical protein
MIQAFHVGNNSSNEIIYILLSNESHFKYESNNLMMTIYPPWKRIHLNSIQKNVYFCTNLIKTSPLLVNRMVTLSKTNLVHFENLRFCSQCDKSNATCEVVYFDIKRFNCSLSTPLTVVYSQNNLFYTQNDAQYYVRNQSLTTQTNHSQFTRMNSILDSLQYIGYYGYATFIATVQRIGQFKWSCNQAVFNNQTQKVTQPFSTLPSTSTSTSTSASATSSQEWRFKRQLIVNDKNGMFALIIFPFSDSDNLDINESFKYTFESMRFVEKQLLSSRFLFIFIELFKLNLNSNLFAFQ